MAFELNGFSDAVLGQLSQIGIEVFSDKRNTELTPKAIYEITTHKKIDNKRTITKDKP